MSLRQHRTTSSLFFLIGSGTSKSSIFIHFPVIVSKGNNDEYCPERVLVTITGPPKGPFSTARDYATGSYSRDGQKNGRPYWVKGDQGLWFYNDRWYIGNEANLGNTIGNGLHSTNSAKCPTGLSWRYHSPRWGWRKAGENVKVEPET